MIDPAYNDLSNREPEYIYNEGFEQQPETNWEEVEDEWFE